MNNNIAKRSRSLVDQQQNRSNDPRRQLSRSKPPDPSIATHSMNNDTFSGLASNNGRSSLESLPQSRRALNKGQQIREDNVGEKTPARVTNWFDNDSTCSLVSKISTGDLAELELHHAAQFAKLLPRNDPTQKTARTGLRKTLSRKVGIRNLFGASNSQRIHYRTESNSKPEPDEVVNSDNDAPDSPVDTIKTGLSTEAGSCASEAKTQSFLLPQCRITRPVPQGSALEVVQLNLQEAILSQISQQAIERAQQDSTSVKGKGKAKSIDSDVEPDELDRELEVTRELMKRVRAALDDGSYEDLHFSANGGTQDSKSERQFILCDILLMLRRAFRLICVSFVRPYRPTGSPVTDQEMIEEMDAYITAQKELNLSHPQMTVEEVLKSLDMDKSNAG